MKNHTNDCLITVSNICTCQPEPRPSRHSDSCQSWAGKDCTCHVAKRVKTDAAVHENFAHRFGRPPHDAQELAEWLAVEANKGRGKAGTSRRIDTDPKVTWLGDQRLVHPLTCGVYKSPEPNWAPYCDCGISLLQHKEIEPEVPETDPADFSKEFTSRAPWWVWTLIGFGAGLPLGAWAGWPSW